MKSASDQNAAARAPLRATDGSAAGVFGGEGVMHDHSRILQMLLANLDGMVYRCRDDANWTMDFVSEGCLALTGYPPEDLLLNSRICYEGITHPEDRQRTREAIHAAVGRRERFDVEYRILRADGACRWVWERGMGLFDAAGKATAIEGFIQDITDRKLAYQALRETERRYRSLFENAIEGIFRSTPAGRYLDANPALARIYGFESPRELMASLSDIRQQLYVDPGRRDDFLRMMQQSGAVTNFESEVYRRNGDIIWISENARSVRGDDGRLLWFEGTVEDITERRAYQARIEHQANYDALTGLANRTLLNDRLDQAIRLAERQGTRVAVAFVDLDNFKFINDSLGHHVGDKLLKTMADRLRSCIRDSDTVARRGGDEFVLLITSQQDEESITWIMQRILASVSQPWVIEEGEFNLTCSVGVATCPDDGRDADTLLKNADSAMYKAKEIGRNNFQFFTTELNVLMTQRVDLESKLRRALERRQFMLHYQPRVDMNTGRIVGAETLIRWKVPGQGLVPPDRFIPLAEDTGLIVPIGKWVLQAACDQNRAWQDAGLEPLVVSVNVSPRQFRRDNLAQAVAEALERSGLEARYLQLELTEGMVMHDAEKLVAMLTDLKELGIQIALDDFGTGYSSLSYLKRFPVDHLKIDQSFVRDIAEDVNDAMIVRAIVTMGHSLDLKVIAEGVETEQQFGFLRRNHCDEMQGYYFSRPLPRQDFTRLLRMQQS